MRTDQRKRIKTVMVKRNKKGKLIRITENNQFNEYKTKDLKETSMQRYSNGIRLQRKERGYINRDKLQIPEEKQLNEATKPSTSVSMHQTKQGNKREVAGLKEQALVGGIKYSERKTLKEILRKNPDRAQIKY